jgi:hypothetical protein
VSVRALGCFAVKVLAFLTKCQRSKIIPHRS